VNDATLLKQINCLPVISSRIVPDPTTMDERESIGNVDNSLKNHLLWDGHFPIAIVLLHLIEITAAAVLDAQQGLTPTLVIGHLEHFDHVGVRSCRVKHESFSWGSGYIRAAALDHFDDAELCGWRRAYERASETDRTLG
jgi:hypothetical protein